MAPRIRPVWVLAIVILQGYQVNAILDDIANIIDLSNVDLAHYEYFRNFPSQNPKTAPQANLFLEHFQKKKAIIDYLDHLFFGISPFTQKSEIVFNPHFGRAWRPYFQRKYGKHGERLVAKLGEGYSLQQLRRYGAIPKEFGTANYPTR